MSEPTAPYGRFTGDGELQHGCKRTAMTALITAGLRASASVDPSIRFDGDDGLKWVVVPAWPKAAVVRRVRRPSDRPRFYSNLRKRFLSFDNFFPAPFSSIGNLLCQQVGRFCENRLEISRYR